MNPLALLAISSTGFVISATWLLYILKKKPIILENDANGKSLT